MAIRLIDRYPTRANPATSQYPHGSGRNKSDPTADDGTPFDQDRFNDQEAFFQGLLTYAGITPSGTVDTVETSDYLDAFNSLAGARQVDSVSALRSGSYPASLGRIWLSGYYGVGTAGGGPLYRKGIGFVSGDENGILFVDADGVGWEAGPSFNYAEDITVTVGSGGDFSTINEALTTLSTLGRNAFETAGSPGDDLSGSAQPSVQIMLLSGFTMAEQVLLDRIDLSWIRISSEDAEVPVETSAMTTNFQPDITDGRFPAFGAQFSKLPIMDILLNFDGSANTEDEIWGFYLIKQSELICLPGAGVKNAKRAGMCATRNTRAHIHDCIFSENGFEGIYANNGGLISARGVTLENNGDNAVRAEEQGYITMDLSTVTGSGNNGIRARNNSVVNARECTISNNSGNGVSSQRGSHINTSTSTMENNSARAIDASTGGTVTAQGVTINGYSSAAIETTQGGSVHAAECSIDGQSAGTSLDAVSCNCGEINIDSATFTGVTGNYVNAVRGSIVRAHGVSGLTANISTNTLTSDGIVFN